MFGSTGIDPTNTLGPRAVGRSAMPLDSALARFAQTGDLAALPAVTRLYAHSVATDSVELRLHRLASARQLVRSGRSGVQLLQPFWQQDPHPAVAATAALEFMMSRPVTPQSPLAGPLEVLHASHHGYAENSGAVLAAVALTGDHRVADVMIRKAAVSLGQVVAGQIAQTHTGLLLAPTIDVYTHLLQRAAAHGNNATVRSLETALTAMVEESSANEVLTLERNFGLRCGQPPVTVVERTPFMEYRAGLLPRLRTLADRYGVPGGLRTAIGSWESRQPAH